MGVEEPPLWEPLPQLVAYAAYVDVHGAVGLAAEVAPDHPVELVPGHDPVGPLHERGKQFQLAGGHPHRSPAGQYEELGWAQLELRGPEHGPVIASRIP